MSSRMKIMESRAGDVTILRLTGRLELEEGDLVFRDYVNRLIAEGRVNILLDLKDVTRIDSAGIAISHSMPSLANGPTSRRSNTAISSDANGSP